MLYEMAAGRPPYEGNSAITVMMKHVNEPMPDARLFNTDLPPGYNAILAKALAKNPNDRYNSANDLAAALRDSSDAPAAPIAAASAASVTEVLSTPPTETAVEMPEPVAEPEPQAAATAVVPPPPPTPATTVESSPPPPSTTPPPPLEPAGKKSKLPLYAGIAVVVILLLGIGGYFALRGNDDSGANELAEATAVPALLPTAEPAATEPIATEEAVVLPEPTEEIVTDIPEPTVEPVVEETAVPILEPTIQAPTRMVFIPSGSFLMGSADGQPDEQPEHEVRLDAYFIDQYEVSNANIRDCVNVGVCEQPVLTNAFTRQNYFNDPTYDNYPVIGVRWTHANAYCQWAGKRLPTEAEWEYAASGPDNFTWPWGNQFDPALSAAGSPDTQPVDAFPDGVSPFGIFNMAGNVNEWVQDTYDPNFYANSPAENPLNEAPGNRIYRGGSFANEDGSFYTTSRRYNKTISYFDVDLGFRCAQDVAGGQ
jgi:formylglycine-generating enzyme required for sulfatase activity